MQLFYLEVDLTANFHLNQVFTTLLQEDLTMEDLLLSPLQKDINLVASCLNSI